MRELFQATPPSLYELSPFSFQFVLECTCSRKSSRINALYYDRALDRDTALRGNPFFINSGDGLSLSESPGPELSADFGLQTRFLVKNARTRGWRSCCPRGLVSATRGKLWEGWFALVKGEGEGRLVTHLNKSATRKKIMLHVVPITRAARARACTHKKEGQSQVSDRDTALMRTRSQIAPPRPRRFPEPFCTRHLQRLL